MIAATGAASLLADSDSGRGSPIGLFVILVLCVAVYFLWKSLNRHLKRVPEEFGPVPAKRGETASRAGSMETSGGDSADHGPAERAGTEPEHPEGGDGRY